MERLTQYFECGAYVDKSNIVDISQVAGQFFEKGAYMGKAIDKLAVFEDFMEEQGFTDLNDLKDCIDNMYDESKCARELKEYKDRWNKLKEYAEKHFEEEPASLAVAFRKVLVRMQELEQGGINEK